MTRRWPPPVARGHGLPTASAAWLGSVAILVVGAAQILQYGGASVGAIHEPVAWLLVLGELALGATLARALRARASERGWRAAVAPESAGLGALAFAGLLVAALVEGAIRGRLDPRAVAELVTWASLGAAAGALVGWRGPRLRLVSLLLVAEVLAIWAVRDAQIWSPANHFYDLKVYLAAGRHAIAGQPVYLAAPLTRLPASAAQDFFLYPPPLIPFLRLAVHLPLWFVSWGWVAFSAGCATLAFRALGLGWGWAIVLLAFPPLVQGVESGNVANVTLLLLAGAYRFGPGLVLGALLKVQTIIPAAWLVRERRWRELAVGIGLVAGLTAATFVFVGVDGWRAWLAGLGYRQQSQVNLPILYGDSLASVLPPLAYVATSGVAIGLALLLKGRRGIAGLGIASIVASPSLWPHGFLVALPAVLALEASALVWLALGLGSGGAAGLWLMTLIGALAIAIRDWDDRPVDADPAHPLGGTHGPWAQAALASNRPTASRAAP